MVRSGCERYALFSSPIAIDITSPSAFAGQKNISFCCTEYFTITMCGIEGEKTNNFKVAEFLRQNV